jgi:cullin 3
MAANKKTQITIKPYRPVQMDPHYADNTWKLLKHAIHEIHKKNASGLSFEELYRYVQVSQVVSQSVSH